MHSRLEDKNFPTGGSQLLRSLARELKNPLILIARQAELEKNGSGSKQSLESIQNTAEKTLQLIDSYLLMAQAEYGQQRLQLRPMGVGSIIYEISRELAPYAKQQNADLVTDVKDASVMANRDGVKAVMWCLSEIALAESGAEQENKSRKEVRIQTERNDHGVSVSVLGSGVVITGSDLESARGMQGESHLASAKLSDSGIRLAIADILTASLGSKLQVRRSHGLKGLSFDLTNSKQLQLV